MTTTERSSRTPQVSPRRGVALLGAVSLVVTMATTVLAAGPASAAPDPVTSTFSYTGGSQHYTVPGGVSALRVTVTGAAGGGDFSTDSTYPGGKGAVVTATVPVGPAAAIRTGDDLVVEVGGAGMDTTESPIPDEASNGGYNGGGNAGGGIRTGSDGLSGFGGGGASDVRLPGGALSDRVVVAAGGGGATTIWSSGGDAGQDAPRRTEDAWVPGGGAGTVTRGGYGAVTRNYWAPELSGQDGSFGLGGAGGPSPDGYISTGGGGGGGYYGGGGGAAYVYMPSGGGGGSSWADPSATGVEVALAAASDPSQVSISTVADVPTIRAHADVTAPATSATGATVDYTTPTATDILDGTAPVTCASPSGARFPIGTTTIECTARNAAGNTASTTFTVTVADSTKPTITAHPDVTTTATSTAGAVVTYTPPTATDNVDATLPLTCTPSSGSTFPIGATTVTCIARDKAGNQTTSAFTVTVNAAVVNKADLKVTLTGPTSATRGKTAIYTVTVKNTGPAAATSTGTVLATTGLGALTAPGATTGTIKVNGTTLTGARWTTPNLASGATASFTATGTVTATSGRTVTATAATLASTPDPALSNNLALTTTRTTG